MDRLKNKVTVVTGGNSGIGLASSRAFVREGAKVMITGRDQEVIKNKHGRIDVLFLSAGIAFRPPCAADNPAGLSCGSFGFPLTRDSSEQESRPACPADRSALCDPCKGRFRHAGKRENEKNENGARQPFGSG